MNTEKIINLENELDAEKALDHPFQADDETPFPVDALPPVMRDIAKGLEWAYKASIDLTGSLTLGIVSACLGKGVRLRTNHPDPTYGLLYLMVSTLPGVNKTTIMKFLVKKILAIQKEKRESQRIAVENIMKEDDRYKAKFPTQRDITREIGKSIVTKVVEHSSQEGLATTLSSNGECLAVISSDCSGVVDDLKGSKSNGNFQGELLLKGYSGESHDSNLKVADDEHLDEVRLSVTWAGTEQTLKEFVFEPRIKSRGLLSRFLFANIDDPIPLRDVEPRVVDAKATHAWGVLVEHLLGSYWQTIEGTEVLMSREAIKELVDFDNARIRSQDYLRHCASLPERWAENAGRIALVLHCAKHVSRAGEHELSVDTMKDAIRVMWWFIGREMAMMGTCGENELENEELKAGVYNYLHDKGPTTANALARNSVLPKRDRHLLRRWVADGDILTWDANEGGRPSLTYAMAGDPRVPQRYEGGQEA
jgi:hypothetical protein